MSKILVSILVLAFLLSLVRVIYNRINSENKTEHISQTEIRIANKLINVGDRIIKSPVQAEFTVYNAGKNDLIIKNVLPDCHCTGAVFSKGPVKPLDSSKIILKYNSTIPGIFQSSATVETNTSDSPLILIFRGNIIDTTKRKL